MKSINILKSTSPYLLLFIGIILLSINTFCVTSQDTLISKTNTNPDPDSDYQIHESKFITINGIKQWITITGENNLNPVILFLHGGPGSPLSPYADIIYNGWEKDFILVQWDQRGAGRTYGYNAPDELNPDFIKANPLTVEQMTEDGIELSEYLIRYLGKQKIILLGTSWGSVLGVRMAIERPDLYYAYVGHSQVVNPFNDLIYDYHKVYKMAQSVKNKAELDTLNSIGLPPYENPKNAGELFRIIKKYERKNSIPAPESWSKPSSQYDNEKDTKHRFDGDDYSFVNYIGYKRFGVKPMASTINLSKDGLYFKIPVYLIQGEEDILTPKEITKDYFTKLKAPRKKFILLSKTAHGFSLLGVEMQHKIMKEYLLPLINKE